MDTLVCACVTAPALAAVGLRIVEQRVRIVGAAWHPGGSVHQGMWHTATLDQECPAKSSVQIGVLCGEEMAEAMYWSDRTGWHWMCFLQHMTGCGKSVQE